MAPNDLLTRNDMDELANMIADRLFEKFKARQEQKEKVPELVSGKWLIEHHYCGIGGYSTLMRRVDDIKLYNPDMVDEIVIKRPGQHTLYNTKKLQEWYQGRLDKKKQDKKVDPRLILKGVI